MIFSLCVIKIMVWSDKADVRRSIRSTSVAASRAELNSSSSRIEPGLSNARAMAIRWAWPSDKPPPDSKHCI